MITNYPINSLIHNEHKILNPFESERMLSWSDTASDTLVTLPDLNTFPGHLDPVSSIPRTYHSNGLMEQSMKIFKILSALFEFFTRLLLCRQHAATITIRAQHTRLIETKRSFSITVPRR